MRIRHGVGFYAARSVRRVARERWPGVKHRIGRVGHAAWKFMGPVAGSIRYQLNDAELRRVATKSAVTLITTGATAATLHSMAFDPEVVGVVISLLATSLLAFSDTAMHMQGGVKPAPLPEPQPQEETKADA